MFLFSRRRQGAGMILAFCLTAAAGVSAAGGGADGPDGYSHLVPVNVSGKQAVVQLPLPRAVYLSARSRDLRDLRVFDAAGSPMPFALVEREQQDQLSRSTLPAAVFPVRGPAGARQGLPDGLEIRTRDDGAVISVTAPSARGATEELTSLVLDIQPPARAANVNESVAVEALTLALPRGADSYHARLQVDTSDDLQRWQPLTEAPVSWLANSQGASVRKDRIEFAPRPFRYARIAWLEGKPVEFAAVSTEFVIRVRAPQQWESVVLPAAAGKGGDDLVYAAPVALPVQAIGLVFHGQNVVLPAVVGQYQEQPGRDVARSSLPELRPVTSATFYQLTQNGRQRVSGEVDVPLTHAAQWVLRPQAKLSDRPDLKLSWKPATIVFVAGGKGPYTLAFGRDGAQAVYQPLAQVAPGFSPHELETLEQARAGQAVRQHADGADSQSPGMLQRREFWLWALLLCGVGALGVMAWRLARQLKDSSSGPPPA
jgi:hypothetical protein